MYVLCKNDFAMLTNSLLKNTKIICTAYTLTYTVCIIMIYLFDIFIMTALLPLY